jgi:hypothetical protein
MGSPTARPSQHADYRWERNHASPNSPTGRASRCDANHVHSRLSLARSAAKQALLISAEAILRAMAMRSGFIGCPRGVGLDPFAGYLDVMRSGSEGGEPHDRHASGPY